MKRSEIRENIFKLVFCGEFHTSSELEDQLNAYLEDVEEELDIDFGDVEFETLNGYLTSFLGHVPSKKDVDVVIKANGYMFTILSIGNKTIGKVRAEKLAEEKNPADKNNS